MILNDKGQDITNNLESDSAEFTIAASAKMFDLLSEKIYADPIRAVIRELSCNAIDANIEAGNVEPIKVYFPTDDKNTLIIEDNGIGMTHEDVMTVYKTYGRSTKSSSNKVIGALGLGGKTPLAYTSQFTLTTARDGESNSYIIFKDENGIPNVNRTSTSPSNKTGTSVEMIVKSEDVYSFYVAAVKTFLFFTKMPIIMRGEDKFYQALSNKFSSSSDMTKTKLHWEACRAELMNDYIGIDEVKKDHSTMLNRIMNTFDSYHGVIMGQVYYTVNSKLILNDAYGKASEMCLNFPSLSSYTTAYKVFHVDLGTVSFQPSREALNYNKATTAFLQKKFYSNWEAFHTEFMSKCNTPAKFLKNYKSVKYANLVNDHSFEKVKDIDDVYRQTIEHVFSKLGNQYAYYARDKRNSWEMANLASLMKEESGKLSDDRSYVKTIFDNILKGTLVNAFVVDETNIVSRFNSFESKTDEKKKLFFNMPSIMKNKLGVLRGQTPLEKMLFINQKTMNVLCTLFPNMNFKMTSELVVEKVKDETVGPKVKGVRNSAPKCWDAVINQYVPFPTGKEKVTYELFEGQPNIRGWWFSPNFDLYRAGHTAKKGNIKIDDSGRANCYNKNYSLDKYADVGDVPHHYLIDWNFFKTYDIINNKKWVWIQTFVYDFFNKSYNKIEKRVMDIQLKGNSLFDRLSDSMLDLLMNTGVKKWANFDKTAFASEIVRYKVDRDFKETDCPQTRNYLLKIESLLTKKYHQTTDDKFKALYQKYGLLQSRFNSTYENAVPPNYITPLVAKYPMLAFAFQNHTLATNGVEAITNYVAEKDNLVKI